MQQNKRKRWGKKNKKHSTISVEAVCKSVGHQGDGVIDYKEKNVHVPLFLKGERALVKVTGTKGEVVEIIEPALDRIDPECAYFSKCGGCSLQHMSGDLYEEFKLSNLKASLASRGLSDVEIADLKKICLSNRRRASFAFKILKDRIIFGYNKRQSHEIVPIDHCLLLDEKLNQSIGDFKALLDVFKKHEQLVSGDLVVTVADNGLDVMVNSDALDDVLPYLLLEKLADFTRNKNWARLAVKRGERGVFEPIAEVKKPFVKFADIAVDIAPGSFLQPSKNGELALVEEVLKTVPKGLSCADLFCGMGSFSFPLLKQAEAGQVLCVDNAGDAIDNLKKAVNREEIPNMSIQNRDLFLNPLYPDELKDFDLVVFDPPRAGAKAQSEQLAKSDIPMVVAVSCNPATFARDARILIDGGYKLNFIKPIDQFSFSAHLELVAVFQKS